MEPVSVSQWQGRPTERAGALHHGVAFPSPGLREVGVSNPAELEKMCASPSQLGDPAILWGKEKSLTNGTVTTVSGPMWIIGT